MKRKIFLFLSCILTVQAVTFNEVVEEELRYVEPETQIEIEYSDDGDEFIKRPEALWSDDGTLNLEVEGNGQMIKKLDEYSITLYEDGEKIYYKFEKNIPGLGSSLMEISYLEGEKNKRFINKVEEIQSDGSFYSNSEVGEYSYQDKMGKWQKNGVTYEYLNDRLHEKVKGSAEYVNGFKHGRWKIEDKNSLEIVNYKYGLKDGKYEEYKDGKLILEGMYKDDNRVGKWIEYDKDKNIINEIEYNEGE